MTRLAVFYKYVTHNPPGFFNRLFQFALHRLCSFLNFLIGLVHFLMCEPTFLLLIFSLVNLHMKNRVQCIINIFNLWLDYSLLIYMMKHSRSAYKPKSLVYAPSKLYVQYKAFAACTYFYSLSTGWDAHLFQETPTFFTDDGFPRDSLPEIIYTSRWKRALWEKIVPEHKPVTP